MQDGNGSGGSGSELAVIDRQTLAQFSEMVSLIPADDDSGANRILQQILSATSWDQLDAPWETSKAQQLAGRQLRLDRATRQASDFREGLGMFLVLHCTDMHNGEGVVVPTSAQAIIGQVVRAYALNAMPLYFEFVIAQRPTKDGYYPQHLRIHGSGATAQAPDPTDADI